MTEEERRCRDAIYSEEVLDLISSPGLWSNQLLREHPPICQEPVNPLYRILHLDRNQVPFYSISSYGYDAIPSLYSLMAQGPLEASGIAPLQVLPSPDLRGQGILLGFIDTGIDYTHPAFRNSDGSSRILSIWDQTLISDHTPPGIPYGTEYSREELNEALRRPDPLTLVPTQDENGHGTFLAGVAAGGPDSSGTFFGAAPEAELVVVKCKKAKKNLREYYQVNHPDVYQSTDLLLGLRYLGQKAMELARPMVICFGMGTNNGAHDGSSVLEISLDRFAAAPGIIPVMASGNEGNRAHHYYGQMTTGEDFREVNLQVAEGENGFVLELWSPPSDLFSLGFLSPQGDEISPIPSLLNESRRLTFPPENTVVEVTYTLTAYGSGNQLIALRFIHPTPGIWKLRIYPDRTGTGSFHLWLPTEDMLSGDTRFLLPDPDVTITSPANAISGITATCWDYARNRLDIYASRGYTADARIRPDLASPGVLIYGPSPGGAFSTWSGSGVAAAVTAGAAACLLTWAVTRGGNPSLDSAGLRALLIRGARRQNVYRYPNREWGYGTLDLSTAFSTLRYG